MSDEPAPSWTLERWLRYWLEFIVWPRRSDATWKNYSIAAEHHIIPRIGGITLERLTGEHVQSVVDELHGDVGLAPGTVRLQWSALNSSLAAAMKRQLLAFNPCEGVALPRNMSRAAFIDPSRVPEFLAVVEAGDWYWAGMFTMALTTGMRHGELAGLRWPSVDLEVGIVHVLEQIARRGARPTWKPPKSAAGRRTLRLPAIAATALERQRDLNRVRRLRAGSRGWREHDLVFPNRRGAPAVSSRVNQELAKVCQVAGIQPVRLHHLRHTYASTLIAEGVPKEVLTKLMGHERSSTTLDIYGHLTEGMGEQSAAVFDRVAARDKDQR